MGNSFSLVNLFTGDWMTLFISLVLVLASIISWAVIIEKIRLWHMNKKNPVKIKNGDNLTLIADKLIRPFDKICGFCQWYRMLHHLSGCLVRFGA